MNFAELSIKRPIFITCTVLIILVTGYLSLNKLGVDLFPNVTIPVVTVTVPYPGAAPNEIETLIAKPVEDELSTISGVKRIKSACSEGSGTVIVEFTLETDVKYAEQQVRDKVAAVKPKLPDDAKEPIIRRIDPADQPILILALQADLPEATLFDIASEEIKQNLLTAKDVGNITIYGGRKREIHVELDRSKLKAHMIPASVVSNRLASGGTNIPAGKVSKSDRELVYRTINEFQSPQEIRDTPISLFGNEVPVRIGQLGEVKDTMEDETSRAYFNGKKAIFLLVYKQSGANTVAVAQEVKKRVGELNKELAKREGTPKLAMANDNSIMIDDNIYDVKETILIGIALTIVVVLLFLGSVRSTIITGLALPNSLLGAFILMAVAGFTVNVMTLLALSLAVGLLIDDAIVVRENIFRHREMGKTARLASIDGTKEVTLAVIATTMTVIAVFLPIAFVSGVVGQFLREFGLTVCFALLISLYDALTIAPMLSSYFGGKISGHGHGNSNHSSPVSEISASPEASKKKKGKSEITPLEALAYSRISREQNRPGLIRKGLGLIGSFFGALEKGLDSILSIFNIFQSWLEDRYASVLKFTLKRPVLILSGAVLIFVASLMLTKYIPKTFLPAQDNGKFQVTLDMPPGTSVEKMAKVAQEVYANMALHKEILVVAMFNTNRTTTMFVEMVPSKQRKMNTSEFKDLLRKELESFSYANPIVKDIDNVGGGQRPFTLVVSGQNGQAVENYAHKLFTRLRESKALLDVDTSYRAGAPEFRVVPDRNREVLLGVPGTVIGSELRTLVEGTTPAVYRENGVEYDIRVRLKEGQRDLKENFYNSFVPNFNNMMIPIQNVARAEETTGLATINRLNRNKSVEIYGDVNPEGPGMGGAMQEVTQITQSELPLPPGIRIGYTGQAENFKEMGTSMGIAMGLGVLFIYMVLASLYESFITPIAIMLVLPLALCGAFIALFLTQKSLDIFSMIGLIMLIGVATKNSILLVDFTNQLIQRGVEMREAIIEAGRERLRPILMTSFALIAGMLPIAIGLNEASKQRTSMGVAIIGGLISSTVLTLVVVPAAFSYIEKLNNFVRRNAPNPDA
ncbi:RND transporter, Hydrophobe/Amphiphile Efflux-1 (HAE1)/Heavy Metal Efflux (HME) family, permease protein [Leptospira inadai serovar Lyme str. 10]|uniref:RND transporter, Hydrophobe/Amphiphile Efflux-1 (HAE1)/Heavy Metal Efflux (HME) family, permease protein n=2 Tax=Leptospira inadai serovar Lyme TaxID=293084 RepID=V6HB41_9LEPT|nr:efflux RND transporter permease subunit [Leptospira inadai]EQA36552.1 RND transporter, Hydrophobe/Amphiphile Efflux-1 (HAE1)/Heavy Metal Efflux (HME) family, permease protein [Leptospira inadai serovar Lyme str. 10]PNV74541.1 multidrug transporter [Leptospira inadai serovar Lyme]